MVRGLVIEVSSKVKTGYDVNTFKKRAHQKILMIAPNVRAEDYNFAGLNYRFTWSANEFEINKVDTVKMQIIRFCKEFLYGWTFKISLNYTEHEEG